MMGHIIKPALPRHEWRVPGLLNLSQTIEINGTAKTPYFYYLGDDAKVANWVPRTGGATLVNSNDGTDPTPDQAGPFNNLNGVLMNGGDHYEDTGSSAGEITTEDVVCEFVIGTGASVTTNEQWFCAKHTGFGNYWACMVDDTGTFTFRISRAGALDVTSSALATNTLYHIMPIMDRSGSGICYVNNVAGSAVDISGKAASWNNISPLTLGGSGSGADTTNLTIYSAAMWIHASGWLDSHLQPTLVNERFMALTGGTGTMNVIK